MDQPRLLPSPVMAGHVPAICARTVGVDGRDTPGHDGNERTGSAKFISADRLS
jgi:hypothetical protein